MVFPLLNPVEGIRLSLAAEYVTGHMGKASRRTESARSARAGGRVDPVILGTVFDAVIDLLAEEPLVLLATVLAMGAIIGSVSIRGVSIGPAGALFAGLVASAIDDRLVIPSIVGFVGLALFTYCVGLAAGPHLSRFLRPSLPVLGLVALLLGALAPVAALIGYVFGLPRAETAGLYAGSLTNTPALAAAQSLLEADERGLPVVGYALAYPYGVVGMLLAVVVTGRCRASGDDHRRPRRRAPEHLGARRRGARPDGRRAPGATRQRAAGLACAARRTAVRAGVRRPARAG
jgi:AspT/YidE/YbjL antiporter-like protein